MIDRHSYHINFVKVDEAIERRKEWIRETEIEGEMEGGEIDRWTNDINFLEEIKDGVEVETLGMAYKLIRMIDRITLGEYKLKFDCGEIFIIIE